jgi:hypothetical protein
MALTHMWIHSNQMDSWRISAPDRSSNGRRNVRTTVPANLRPSSAVNAYSSENNRAALVLECDKLISMQGPFVVFY